MTAGMQEYRGMKEKKGHDKVVELLQSRADIHVNEADMYGSTPLSLAAETGHDQVVEILLKKDGIQVNPADWTGATPLSLAAQERHGRVVEMLLRKEEIRVIGWNGWRPHRRITATPSLPIGHSGARSITYMK